MSKPCIAAVICTLLCAVFFSGCIQETEEGTIKLTEEYYSDCAKPAQTNAQKDYCYMELAEQHNDASYCRKIKDPDTKEECKNRFAVY